jgi:hypothetical protein
MMAITTRSSISVKPFLSIRSHLLCKFFFQQLPSDEQDIMSGNILVAKKNYSAKHKKSL